MRELLRVIKRLLAKLIGLDLFRWEEDAVGQTREIENMRARLAELKSAATRVVACQYRLERSLSAEEMRLAEVESADQDDEARLVRAEICRARVAELRRDLESAANDAGEAKQCLELFREELRQAESRVRDARVRLQLAEMKTQMETAALDASFGGAMAEIERLERKASSAQAEADAIAELNQALGHRPQPDDNRPEGGSGR